MSIYFATCSTVLPVGVELELVKPCTVQHIGYCYGI